MATKRSRASSSRTPDQDYMGLTKIRGGFTSRWANLAKRTIQPTSFAHMATLKKLGIEEPVFQLLDKVGLGFFCTKHEPTYRRFTLEFLATLQLEEREDGRYITFNLNDTRYEVGYEQLKAIFCWNYDTGIEDFLDVPGFDMETFWRAITGRATSRGDRSSLIVYPALRFVYRYLSSTILCNGEPTLFSKFDIKCLWAMTSEVRTHPDWVDYWVRMCLKLSSTHKGKISMGGMVTIIARALNVEIPGIEHSITGKPDYFYDIQKLVGVKMIQIIGDDFVWMYGPHKFMILPQVYRCRLSENIHPSALFLEPDQEFARDFWVALNADNLARRPVPHLPPRGHSVQLPPQPQSQPDDSMTEPFQPQPEYGTLLASIDQNVRAMQQQVNRIEQTQHQMHGQFTREFDIFYQRLDFLEDGVESIIPMLRSSHMDDNSSIDAETCRRHKQEERIRRHSRRYGGAGPSCS